MGNPPRMILYAKRDFGSHSTTSSKTLTPFEPKPRTQPRPFLSGRPSFSSHELLKPAQFFQSAWSVYLSHTLSTGAENRRVTLMCCILSPSPLVSCSPC